MPHPRRFDTSASPSPTSTQQRHSSSGFVYKSKAGRSWRASFSTLSAASPTPAPNRHATAARRRYRARTVEFVRPDHKPGSRAAMANELGLRNVAFEVDDLQAAVDQLAADGYRLVGGIGQYEHIWRMPYVRGPEGIIVSLTERIG
jgi:catechol 2,3-dioxygenase-like lactoylglutathione lyase family enzyme